MEESSAFYGLPHMMAGDREKAEENGEEATIRFAWWGNQDRAEKTIEAVRLIQEGAVRPCYSNQLLELSELSGKQLKLLLLPGPNTELGMDIRSGSHICMPSGSGQKEAAAKLIDFMINDVDANRILNAEYRKSGGKAQFSGRPFGGMGYLCV